MVIVGRITSSSAGTAETSVLSEHASTTSARGASLRGFALLQRPPFPFYQDYWHKLRNRYLPGLLRNHELITHGIR